MRKKTTVRFLIQTSAAVKHLALKRGRLFAVGSNITVGSLASLLGQNVWLSAELPAGSKKAWDIAHELADKVARDLCQAAFVEPDTADSACRSRYSQLMNPRPPAQGTLNRPRARSGMIIPGLANNFGLPGGRHAGARSMSPFGANVGGMALSVAAIPDPLAEIMLHIPDEVFGGITEPEPLSDSDRMPVDLVREALEKLPQWSEFGTAKQEMFVTEAAQISASGDSARYDFDTDLLLESLRNAPEISGMLLKLIS